MEDYTVFGHSMDGIEAFLRVADSQNFRAAARDIGISPSALSQKIRALEERLGIALLTRTTRRVGLTQAGQILLARAKPAYDQLASTYDEVRNLSRPAGLLRLHAHRRFAAGLLDPLLAEFCQAYPDIEVEIFTDIFPADLIENGFDAGVNMGEFLDTDFVALRLTGPINFVVVGSPEYFSQHLPPANPEDLPNHSCIRLRLGRALIQWSFYRDGREVDFPVRGPLITNDPATAVTAAKNGIGLAYVAEAQVVNELREGSLVSVMHDIIPPSRGAYLYYPNRENVLPKLRVFIDFVKSRINIVDV